LAKVSARPARRLGPKIAENPRADGAMPLQATSVLQTHAPLIVLAYVALGTVVYSLFEGWPLIDAGASPRIRAAHHCCVRKQRRSPCAAYFTCVTVMTVGYGDLTPKKDAAKCFLMLCGAPTQPSRRTRRRASASEPRRAAPGIWRSRSPSSPPRWARSSRE